MVKTEGCTACPDGLSLDSKDRIFRCPRRGVGPDSAELFIVGRNPTEAKALHGAFGIHYPSIYPELKMLLHRLDLQPWDVYATNAVKCPTHNDHLPSRHLAWRCSDLYLRSEIKLCKPKVILALGPVAHDVIGMIFKYPWVSSESRVFNVPSMGRGCGLTIRAYRTIIVAPHPDNVSPLDGEIVEGHYYNAGSWLDAIAKAYKWIKEKE